MYFNKTRTASSQLFVFLLISIVYGSMCCGEKIILIGIQVGNRSTSKYKQKGILDQE